MQMIKHCPEASSKLLRERLTASGGARSHHVPPCTLRFLRSGGHRQPPARYILSWLLGLLLAAPLLLAQAEVRELEWLELMPEDEATAWLEDSAQIDHSGFSLPEPFQSFRTMPELDGQTVRIPGFVVPVETDGRGRLKEFFLVPYFGACIHVPPPPANQIIYGRLEPPMPMVNIWDAFWMEGVLNVEEISNATAASAYTMDVEKLELY